MTSKRSRRSFVRTVAAAGAAGTLSRAETLAFAPPKNIGKLNGVQLAIATTCVDGFGMHRHEPSFRVITELGFTNVEFNLRYPELIASRYIESIQSRRNRSGLTPVRIQASSFGGAGKCRHCQGSGSRIGSARCLQGIGCDNFEVHGRQAREQWRLGVGDRSSETSSSGCGR